MKKSHIVVALALSTALLLGGCGVDASDLENEVAQALADNAEEDTAEVVEETKEEEVEPEPALEYVEIEEPDTEAMTDDSLAEAVVTEASMEDNQGNVESEQVVEAAALDDGILQIVFLGDSIFDSVRDETGIAHQVGELLEADIYNLSIGGTTAGLRTDKNTQIENWNEPSLMGVLYTLDGKCNNGLLSSFKAGEVLSTLEDPSATDYFVIEYGTNDFLWYIPLGTSDYQGQYYYYFRSSLSLAVDEIQREYPNAQIILCTPYYEEYWSADRSRYIGDCHSVNNGYGTLLDYISVVKDTAHEYELPYLDMYDLMEIDQNNVNDMTVDGIHPSETARHRYARVLYKAIKGLEEGTFNQDDFDPA